ncbi:MFS transporter [Rhodococcus sp. G-MC3]|uniref:MFS transporter n=1 Tax=Rhodococcus sp. G-MC3 TaxID=3046209 RepID=UPI0024BB4EB4|nr:MFS transporter [Rhodococcus sp. G-MC3]MDJ0396807.1 MFS transporter [Rhodococcus sp. G-MC3]
MALTTNTDQPGIGTVGEVRRARWTVFVLCAAALLVIGQLYSVVPLLNVLAVRWSVTPSVAAWLVTVFGLAYAIGMLISGPLSDRFGRRRLATIGVFATAAFTLTVAFSPNFPVALCLRIAQGLAAACFAPAVLAYIPERVTPSRRAFALSALIGSFLAAAIVAPMVAGPR